MCSEISGDSGQRPRLAIIGAGPWGRRLAKGFSNHADVVAFASNGNLENVKWWKEHHPSIEHVDVEDLFNGELDYDALVVASGIDSLGPYALRGAKAGKHVFVEKPCRGIHCGYDTREGATVYKPYVCWAEEEAHKHGKKFFIGYKHFYGHALTKFQDVTRTQPLDHLNFKWHKFGTFKESIVWNLACHDIAMAMYLFGDPIDIEIVQMSKHKCDIRLLFEGGKYATFDIDRMTRSHEHVVKKNFYTFLDFDWMDPLPNECLAFIRCIKGEEEPIIDAKFASRVLDVLEKIQLRNSRSRKRWIV